MKKEKCYYCSQDIIHLDFAKVTRCDVCGKKFETKETCPDSHSICNECKQLPLPEYMEQFSLNSGLRDPIAVFSILLSHPSVFVTDRSHHFAILVTLITVYYNVKGMSEEKDAMLQIARCEYAQTFSLLAGVRSIGTEAFGVSTFLNLISDSLSLHAEDQLWRISNQLLAKCFDAIAQYEGKRCALRDDFIVILETLHFLREHFNIVISHTGVDCRFSHINPQCVRSACPYFSFMRGGDKPT